MFFYTQTATKTTVNNIGNVVAEEQMLGPLRRIYEIIIEDKTIILTHQSETLRYSRQRKPSR